MSQLNGTEELDAYILRNTRTKANVSRNKPSLSSRPLDVNLMRSPKFPVAKATTNNLKSSASRGIPRGKREQQGHIHSPRYLKSKSFVIAFQTLSQRASGAQKTDLALPASPKYKNAHHAIPSYAGKSLNGGILESKPPETKAAVARMEQHLQRYEMEPALSAQVGHDLGVSQAAQLSSRLAARTYIHLGATDEYCGYRPQHLQRERHQTCTGGRHAHQAAPTSTPPTCVARSPCTSVPVWLQPELYCSSTYLSNVHKEREVPVADEGSHHTARRKLNFQFSSILPASPRPSAALDGPLTLSSAQLLHPPSTEPRPLPRPIHPPPPWVCRNEIKTTCTNSNARLCQAAPCPPQQREATRPLSSVQHAGTSPKSPTPMLACSAISQGCQTSPDYFGPVPSWQPRLNPSPLQQNARSSGLCTPVGRPFHNHTRGDAEAAPGLPLELPSQRLQWQRWEPELDSGLRTPHAAPVPLPAGAEQECQPRRLWWATGGPRPFSAGHATPAHPQPRSSLPGRPGSSPATLRRAARMLQGAVVAITEQDKGGTGGLGGCSTGDMTSIAALGGKGWLSPSPELAEAGTLGQECAAEADGYLERARQTVVARKAASVIRVPCGSSPHRLGVPRTLVSHLGTLCQAQCFETMQRDTYRFSIPVTLQHSMQRVQQLLSDGGSDDGQSETSTVHSWVEAQSITHQISPTHKKLLQAISPTASCKESDHSSAATSARLGSVGLLERNAPKVNGLVCDDIVGICQELADVNNALHGRRNFFLKWLNNVTEEHRESADDS